MAYCTNHEVLSITILVVCRLYSHPNAGTVLTYSIGSVFDIIYLQQMIYLITPYKKIFNWTRRSRKVVLDQRGSMTSSNVYTTTPSNEPSNEP